MGAGRASADPVPALHQKFLLRPVGFQVEGGHDSISDQNWATEVAKYPLVLRNISLEPILVIEEEPEPLPLDDKGVERGENMNLFLRFLRRAGNSIESFPAHPVLR